MAYKILIPRPGIKPAPPALEAWSLNHWTAREVLKIILEIRRREGGSGEGGGGRGRRGGGRNADIQLVKPFFRTPRYPAGDINSMYSMKSEKKH